MTKFHNSLGGQREKVWLENISSQTFSRWPSKLFSNLVIHHLPAYEDGTECSETSAYEIQAPGNYPKENIQHTEHGESLKSRLQNFTARTALTTSCSLFLLALTQHNTTHHHHYTVSLVASFPVTRSAV